MMTLNSTWQGSSPIRRIPILITIIFICLYSRHVIGANTLWEYLAQHNTSAELMDITSDKERIFLAGVRNVIVPWDNNSTPEAESIVMPSGSFTKL